MHGLGVWVGDLRSCIPWNETNQAFQLPATLATTAIQARASRGGTFDGEEDVFATVVVSNTPQKLNIDTLGVAPSQATVTTRIIPFLVGNPYKPLFDTVTGKGPYPIDTTFWGIHFYFGIHHIPKHHHFGYPVDFRSFTLEFVVYWVPKLQLGGGNSNISYFHPKNWGSELVWLTCFKRVETTN